MAGEARVCVCQDIRFDFSLAETENMVPTFRMGVKDHVHNQSPFMNDGCCEAVMGKCILNLYIFKWLLMIL